MKNLIFLDIDGVIATPECLEDGMWGLVESKQELLGKIIESTDAKIVLSSSWRLHTVEDTVAYMNKKGFRFSDRIIGVTIRGYHYIQKGFPMSICRGVEIKQWIDNNIHRENGQGAFVRKKIQVDYNYVILDDDTDMLLEQQRHFVQCDPKTGLTNYEVEKAISILNPQPHEQ
jgi:hypothetical protein